MEGERIDGRRPTPWLIRRARAPRVPIVVAVPRVALLVTVEEEAGVDEWALEAVGPRTTRGS